MVIENWGNNERNWVSKIDTGLKKSINAILVDEDSETVFVGGENKLLRQFNLKDGKFIQQFKTKVNEIQSLTLFKHLLCVGGSRNHFNLIDLREKNVLTRHSTKKSVKLVYSSQFLVSRSERKDKVCLALSGGNSMFLLLMFM